jgi:hypothetical protein
MLVISRFTSSWAEAGCAVPRLPSANAAAAASHTLRTVFLMMRLPLVIAMLVVLAFGEPAV